MRNTRWILVVALALAATACKKDAAKPDDKGKGSGAPVAAPATPMVADVAAVDALWALAPPGAIGGEVITGKALVLVDKALSNMRGILSRTQGLEAAAAQLDVVKKEIVGTANSYADAGLALEQGLAFFTGGDKRTVLVLPVADRAKFVASRGGTTQGDVDRIGELTCKPVAARYACSEDPAFLALGGGDLGKHAGVNGVRGDGELVFVLPPADPQAPMPFEPTGPITATLNIRDGELVLRGNLPAKLLGPLAEIAALPRAKLDVDAAGGFLIVPLGMATRTLPDVPIVPGVTLHALFGSFAGPLQAVVPAGANDVDVRIALKDPAPASAVVGKCGELGKLLPVTPGPDGSCQVGPIPQLGVSAAVWVEGNELRAAKARGPAPTVLAASPPSPAGKELAGYTGAFWGHGLLVGAGVANLPPQAVAMMSAFSTLTELGMGADFRPDGISVLIVGRTIHQNPYALFTRLDAALASGDAAIVEALAKENPGSPLAHDYAAGPLGLAVPSFSVGVLAAIAIPAFLQYMGKGKASESDLNLNRIAKAANAHRIRTGSFPAGKSALLPAKDCCTTPSKKCDPDPAAWAKDPVWSALEFSIEEPHRFQYRYEGTATAFTVTAEADLDCDQQGKTVHTGRASLDPQGNPSIRFETSAGPD
jgi:hypothetical protein